MVQKVVIRRFIELFTRALEKIYLYYRNHFIFHRPQRSMECFTNTELADMHLIYVLPEGNARAAQDRLYRKRYPQRDTRDHRMFTNLRHNLCECESLRINRHREGRTRVTRTLSWTQL
ncbi:hypothetical protein TNCV_2958961 [Trichonephila clavipes]|nr:hypothetical protein TNCV_2958961 [Trichonephila clavipes]